MKTILALAVALLVSAGTATAQTSFGVKAGLNLATLSISEADDTFEPENRTGFVAGVFATFRGGGVFAFQPEALISMQGAKFSDGTDSGTARIDYFQVPLLARIGPSNVGIVVGPSFGYRIRAKLSAAGLSTEDEDFSDQIKRMDVGLVAGVFATFRGGGIFAFQPEALVSMQGAKFTDGTNTGTAKIDYFQVPLLARIGPSNVGIVVGPSFGYRIRAKLTGAGLEPEDEDFSDQIKRMDVGLVAGLTADVGRLVLDGRYTWGLTNIEEEATADKTKTRVISLTVGLRF